MLPDDWTQWSPAQLDAVLLHEREHARRRDPLIQWFALLNRAVFWFHPLAWWLERRLAALAEDACDAAVLARGHQPAEYCEYLLSLARAVKGAGARVEIVGAAMPGAFLLATYPPHSQGEPGITDHAASAGVGAVGVCRCVRRRDGGDARSRAVSRRHDGAGRSRLAARTFQNSWFEDDEWHLETAPLLTSDEMRAYMRLKTSAERDSFIADFWRRHDPTPKTPANEFRREFERRIRFAKERYAEPDSAATLAIRPIAGVGM
jgi:hypothetical protein